MLPKRLHDRDENDFEEEFSDNETRPNNIHSSPRKRSRPSFPQTPAAARRAISCSSAIPRTPYTPYPLHASDSPSNPFGSKRKERLTRSLPPTTPFGKHLALRFQYVRRDVHPCMGGVYRTVRVPTNYTFAHLRALIAWLYQTPARHAVSDDYLFEVMNKVSMYSPLYKPGQFKSGTTAVKVSNVRDPARWQSGYGLDGEEDELLSQEEVDERASDAGDLIEEDWDWADEEDFTIGHAWPMGLDPLIGIIYYHSTDTQIHISLNTTKLPRQRGSSNTPHVFNARGRAYLSQAPLPRPMFTKPILSSPPAYQPRMQLPLPTNDEDLSDTDANGDVEFTSSHPFFGSPNKPGPVILVEDSDDEAQAPDADDRTENYALQPSLAHWNEPAHAFALYLLQFMDPQGVPKGDVDASFFEKEASYDPFDNDDDLVRAVKLPPAPFEEYEDDEEEDDEVIDLRDSERDDEAGEDAEYDEDEVYEKFEYAPPLAQELSDDEEDEEDIYNTHAFNLGSTPDLTSRASSSLPGSSPPRPSSPVSEGFVLAEHYPNTKYTFTPAPPRERTHRLRLGRLERRIKRMKSKEFLTLYDEVEVEEAAVDELAGDGDEDKVLSQMEQKGPRAAQEGTQAVEEVQEAELWDIFAEDEDEV